MSTPDISVYIPSHNYGRFLGDAVESVLRQTVSNWELLIIDDGSTDHTQEVINLYQGDDRIRTFRTEGIGLPAVCNMALRESRGKYLIRLDGDDLFDPNILLVLHHELSTHPELAMVFPDYYLMDDFGEVFSHERREKLFEANHMLDSPANGACSLIRKNVLMELGGYREDLGAQDGWDLWNKLMKKHRVGNVNLPLFYYRRHGKNLTDTPQRILKARSQITMDNMAEKISDFAPVTALIPCRQHYDFLPDIWKAPIAGQSLLAHNLEKCLKSELFDQVVVLSDTPKVKEVMKGFAEPRLKFLPRTTEDTIRSRGLSRALLGYGEAQDFGGVTVISYLQAPLVTTRTLEEAVGTLVLNNADSAMGVEEMDDPFYKRGAHGLFPLNPARPYRSDFDVIYKEANTAMAFKTGNLKQGSITGSAMVHFTVGKDECFFIDSPQKMKIAELLMEGA